MTDISRKILDEISAGAVLEVDYYGKSLEDVRTGVGVYVETVKVVGEWCLRFQNRRDIPTIDVKEIRVLQHAGRE